MAFLKAASFGTLLCLAGLALLLLATISTPIVKSFYFLSADVSGAGTGAASGISASARLTLGTFGFCVTGIDIGCTPVKLGYDLSDNNLLDAVGQVINLPNSLIRGLTYVLILHPISCGLGLIAAIFGLLAHRREMAFTMTLIATWFASLATLIGMLAFIFDMVVFTIAKQRINRASSSNDAIEVSAAGAYGNAIWITLAGWLCFLLSGVAFRIGRRIARARQQDKMASEALRPKVDDSYATSARDSARFAEQRRAASSKDEGDLPYFAEPETVPLRAYNDPTEFGHGGGHGQMATTSTSGYDRDAIDGVGMGYGRRAPHQYQDSMGGNDYRQGSPVEMADFRHSRVGSTYPPAQPVRSGSQPEPFSSMYTTAPSPPPQVPSPAQRPEVLQAGPQYNHRASAIPMTLPQPGLLGASHQSSYSAADYYTPTGDQQPRQDRMQSVTSMYSQGEQQAYDPPPLPTSAAYPAAGYYATSQAPTYQTEEPTHQSSFNYFAAQNTGDYPAPQPQRYSQTGPLAQQDYAYTTDAPQTQTRSPTRSPVGSRVPRSQINSSYPSQYGQQ